MAQSSFLARITAGRLSGCLVLMGLMAASTGVELVLQGADHGLWGSGSWRGLAYQYGGFWAGLLRDWHPNYRLQPEMMFLTYSLLHAGLGHLLGNMLSLALLGDMVTDRIGGRGLAWLYVVSALGGALGFGLLNHSPAPMIGASGAIFGLAGALTVWSAKRRRQWASVGLIMLALAGLNLAIWLLQAGNLAWEAHLGGFVAGACFAVYPRSLAKTRS